MEGGCLAGDGEDQRWVWWSDSGKDFPAQWAWGLPDKHGRSDVCVYPNFHKLHWKTWRELKDRIHGARTRMCAGTPTQSSGSAWGKVGTRSINASWVVASTALPPPHSLCNLPLKVPSTTHRVLKSHHHHRCQGTHRKPLGCSFHRVWRHICGRSHLHRWLEERGGLEKVRVCQSHTLILSGVPYPRVYLQAFAHISSGLGRSPGEGNGNPLQYSCLENPMDRGAWQATVHRVTKRQTWLSDFTSLAVVKI